MYAVHARPNILLNHFVCLGILFRARFTQYATINDLIIKKDAIIGTAQKAADHSNSILREILLLHHKNAS